MAQEGVVRPGNIIPLLWRYMFQAGKKLSSKSVLRSCLIHLYQAPRAKKSRTIPAKIAMPTQLLCRKALKQF